MVPVVDLLNDAHRLILEVPPLLLPKCSIEVHATLFPLYEVSQPGFCNPSTLFRPNPKQCRRIKLVAMRILYLIASKTIVPRTPFPSSRGHCRRHHGGLNLSMLHGCALSSAMVWPPWKHTTFWCREYPGESHRAPCGVEPTRETWVWNSVGWAGLQGRADLHEGIGMAASGLSIEALHGHVPSFGGIGSMGCVGRAPVPNDFLPKASEPWLNEWARTDYRDVRWALNTKSLEPQLEFVL